ncbi:TIGR00269 family protein [Vulcanisaeta thermophila]|uniref:TIGR00269 family protein n=1 Tax=Vulcanisaeta thermophila TaxID=867917 RepID=UPI000853A3A8|nr:TIGR00269 family protein [Vulcanisaeta thermophila]
MEPPICTRCGRRVANYYRASSGEKLCLHCLFNSIEDTVLWTIRKYGLIEPNDRVGIAISGGKDSLTLMYILGKLRRQGKIPSSVEFVAFSINEGQPFSCYYRMNRVDFVRKLSEEFNIPYRVYSFKELFGVTAMDVAHGLWSRGLNIHMCTIDGVLRRRAMNIIGRELGLTKIATGHNLDDEAQTVLLNVLSNNLNRFAWFGPKPITEREDLIPRIKPLRFVREEEIAIYAYYHGIPLMELECPFVYSNPRYELKFTISRWERENPNIKHSLVSFGDSLAGLLTGGGSVPELRRCKYCGEPTSGDVCRVCDLMGKAGLLERYLGHLRTLNTTTTHSPS